MNSYKDICATKVNILYLMGGDPAIFGGGKRVFMQLMSLLNREHFKIHSCCALSKDQEELLRRFGGKIVDIDIQHCGLPSSLKRLCRYVIENDLHIIHSQGARANFYARLAVRLSGRRTKVVNSMAMLTEDYDVGYAKKTIYCSLDRFSERYVNMFLPVSDALKKRLLEQHTIPARRIARIYNGIELEEYQPDISGKASLEIRKEFGIDKDQLIVGGVGRLTWGKGFEVLIKAIQPIIKAVPEAKILIVGDGPLKGKLERMGEMLNVNSNLIFSGFRNDVRSLLSAIDVFVLPSFAEGFPMITLEAMAMLKPIIATNIDGITEQITDGKHGILVPPGDPDALSKAIMGLINDKQLAKNMGTEARKRVEKEFSVEKMVAETEKVYQSLCGRQMEHHEDIDAN